MDDTQSTGGFAWDSWLAARVGNAIDAGVDRVINRPAVMYDQGQAYGMDDQGRIYTLGQTNAQIAANVRPTAFGGINPVLLIAAVVVVVLLESK